MPSSVLQRVIASFWWIFSVVITATFTANLLAFVTVEKPSTPFNWSEEMVKQKEYKFGIAGGSAASDFFQVKRTDTKISFL